jgi:hypothetical protein
MPKIPVDLVGDPKINTQISTSSRQNMLQYLNGIASF